MLRRDACYGQGHGNSQCGYLHAGGWLLGWHFVADILTALGAMLTPMKPETQQNSQEDFI